MVECLLFGGEGSIIVLGGEDGLGFRVFILCCVLHGCSFFVKPFLDLC